MTQGETGQGGYASGLRRVAGSWRLLSVVLLSFSSGLPLGVVWLAIPAWMAREGVDIKVIGLFTLAQAPWSFKLLWSPAMDQVTRVPAPSGLRVNTLAFTAANGLMNSRRMATRSFGTASMTVIRPSPTSSFPAQR